MKKQRNIIKKGFAKRCICTLIILTMLCGFSTAFAEMYWYNFPEIGASFDLSSDWQKMSETDNTISFKHYTSDQQMEQIYVNFTYTPQFNNIDSVEKQALDDYLSDYMSNYNLSKRLSDNNNGSYVTVTANSEQSGYEIYNNRKWYKYEKDYTARATGYQTAQFYDACLVTVIDQRFIEIMYTRNSQRNHFDDVAAMLDSITVSSSTSNTNSEISIFINGEEIYPDSPAMMIDDRTLVPIRAVAEKLGYSVGWNEETSTVVLMNSNGNTVMFKIGDNRALKNGSYFNLDVPAQIIGERTYLPLRAAATAMNANVNWNERNNSVEIYY